MLLLQTFPEFPKIAKMFQNQNLGPQKTPKQVKFARIELGIETYVKKAHGFAPKTSTNSKNEKFITIEFWHPKML